MDIQQGILGDYPGTAPLLENVAKAIAGVRAQHILVIYAGSASGKECPK